MMSYPCQFPGVSAITSPSVEAVAGVGSPAEFGATDFIEIVILRMDQAQFFRLFAHHDFIIHRGYLMSLTITGHVRADIALVTHHHPDLRVAVDHNGPTAEGMRVEGHHHNRVESRVHVGSYAPHNT